MYSDSQIVTINAVPHTLRRVASGENKGAFRKDDGLVRLNFSHSYPKGRASRLVKLEHFKTVTDPYLTGTSLPVGMSAHLVVQAPEIGYTITEAKQVVDGFIAWLSASSGANITTLLGGES